MAPAVATTHEDLANGTSPSGQDLPPIAALFLIHFDIKAGCVAFTSQKGYVAIDV